MTNFQQIYHDLEAALNEFFNPSTSNKRKQEIGNYFSYKSCPDFFCSEFLL